MSSAKKHIYKIKRLIRDYYDLDPGVRIDRYDELLKVTSNPRVYISRRALKHFVESRKKEMEMSKGKEEIFQRLYFAIDGMGLVIGKYDELTLEEKGKNIYSKNFGTEIKSSIRIVTEFVRGHEEIKSIHFQKNKKTT